MRLKKYMDVYDILESIQKECSYYLSLTGGKPFYKGMSKMLGDFGKKKVRKDRKSLGMLSNEADGLNKWLVQNGHCDRSKSVIASSSRSHCSEFGSSVFAIYPIGKFK